MNTRRCVAAVAVAVALTAAAAAVGGTAHAAAPGDPKVPVPGCCERVRLARGETITPGSDQHRLVATGLPPAGSGGPNSVYGVTETGFALDLQTDGNLVEYQTDTDGVTRPVWWTGTSTGARLTFQDDGNVVLYDAGDRALWASGTAGSSTAATFAPYGNGQVVTQDAAGRVLAAVGPARTPLPGVLVQGAAAPGRLVVLDVQSDGNVVEYDVTDPDRPRVLWQTATAGVGPVRLVDQADGNLVVYRVATGWAVWASGSRGPSGYYQLDAQDDGNLVLYRTDGVTRLNAVWASGTRR